MSSEERALWLAELLPVSCRPFMHAKVSSSAVRSEVLDGYCSEDPVSAQHGRPGSVGGPAASALHRDRVSETKIPAARASDDWGLLGKFSCKLAAALLSSHMWVLGSCDMNAVRNFHVVCAMVSWCPGERGVTVSWTCRRMCHRTHLRLTFLSLVVWSLIVSWND